MKLRASLGLFASILMTACGDSGSASTGTGATTDTTTGGTTDPGPTTGPTTSTTTSTDSIGESMGETTGVDTTTSTTSATTSTDSTDTGVATDTDATSTTVGPDSTTTEGDTTSSGSSDSSTGDPVGEPLAIALADIVIYANCQPIIDPDSILGWWTVTYDNTQGAATGSAELTKATLTLSPNDMPSVHDITAIPTQSGPVGPGETLSQEQMKQKGAPTPGCGFCNQPYRLDLNFVSGGVDVPVVHEATLDCVY
ncbi:hypothetical protein [Nannocystis pusilla]|uniref:hypothetical protein n=1 Tax=Nannocystis pusilla TaxID=889268 RepID=UPI003DA34866